jgi:methylaspartate ammonia-lyase
MTRKSAFVFRAHAALRTGAAEDGSGDARAQAKNPERSPII